MTPGQNNFRRIAFILWDKLIYEYINRQWRGSSDSKIAGNILNLEREPDLYEPVPAYKWEGLLRDQIFAESVIESVDITLALMKPLLYHFTASNAYRVPIRIMG